MKQAITAYKRITVTPEFREIERLYSRARHNEASALGHAHEKGKTEGKTEKALDIAKNLLGIGVSVEDIISVTGLTRAEVEELQTSTKF